MSISECFQKGGEWVSGLTPLSSRCARGSDDILPAHPPSESDILIQKEKDPPPKGGETDVERIVEISRMRSHLLGMRTATLGGLGPTNEKVSWPLSPGDVVWKAVTPGRSNVDETRECGIYLGEGIIIHLGRMKRAVTTIEGRAYWKAVVDPGSNERAKVVTPSGFMAGAAARCGVYNRECRGMPRVASVLLGAACHGVLLRRLARPDAQHIAAYIRTGVWLAESPAAMDRRIAAPVHFRGEFSKSSVVERAPGFDKSSVSVEMKSVGEPGEIPQESTSAFVVMHELEGKFSVSYPTVPLAEELLRQKEMVQPFHDPLTGRFLAEDQVALIFLTSMTVAVKDRKEEIDYV